MSRRSIVVGILLVLVLLLGTAGLALSQPQITVHPKTGYHGQKFEITCTGFYPGDDVTQSFFLPDGTLAFAGMKTSDMSGNVDCWNWTSGPDEPVGKYRVTVSGVESGDAETTFEVLEEEFVPEPGSMLLLGSGLTGLAGYAGLRWRARRS